MSATRPPVHFAPATVVRVAAPIVMPRPPSLAAAVAGSAVTLTWTTPGGAARDATYLLEAGSRSGRSDLVDADTRSSTAALTITNVPPGTYFFRVRARNASGTSAASNEIVIAIPADCLTAPGAPSGLVAGIDGATVTLSWQPPSGACPATAYTIEAGSAPGLANLANFSTGTTATTFTATSVPSGTYYVRVKATSAGGSSGASNEVSFRVGTGPCTTPPAAPTAFSASVTGTTVVLTWTAPSGTPSAYIIEAGSTPGASNLVVSDTGSTATSLTATAAPGTYYARLRARNACGTSAPSNEIVVVVNTGSTQDAVLQASFRGVEDPGDASFDATIAAGPSSLVVARNQWITIRDKAGAVIATKNLQDFFSAVRTRGANGFTDPYVIFDPDSQRFFLANADRVMSTSCTPGTCLAYVLLAVSKTATPSALDASDWYFYSLDQTIERTTQGTRTVAKWGDFPFMTVVGNTLAMSMAMLDFVFTGADVGSVTVRLLDKSVLIRGGSVTTWTDFTGLDGVTLPAIAFGDPGGIVLVGAHPCTFQISRIVNPLSSPILTSRTVTTCAAGNQSSDRYATQPGGPPIVVAGPKQQFVYRDGSLWVAEPTAQSGAAWAIHWAQIDVKGWPDNLKIVQSGTFGVGGVHHWVPAIMADAAGNMAIVYERSSPTEFVSAYYTWRRASDPPGTLRPGAVLQAGLAPWSFFAGSGGTNRFVDYLGSALDPRDGSMWMLGMYARTSSVSGTWVGHLVFP